MGMSLGVTLCAEVRFSVLVNLSARAHTHTPITICGCMNAANLSFIDTHIILSVDWSSGFNKAKLSYTDRQRSSQWPKLDNFALMGGFLCLKTHKCCPKCGSVWSSFTLCTVCFPQVRISLHNKRKDLENEAWKRAKEVCWKAWNSRGIQELTRKWQIGTSCFVQSAQVLEHICRTPSPAAMQTLVFQSFWILFSPVGGDTLEPRAAEFFCLLVPLTSRSVVRVLIIQLRNAPVIRTGSCVDWFKTHLLTALPAYLLFIWLIELRWAKADIAFVTLGLLLAEAKCIWNRNWWIQWSECWLYIKDTILNAVVFS